MEIDGICVKSVADICLYASARRGSPGAVGGGGLHYNGDTKPHQDLIPTRLPELNDIFNKCQSEFYTNFSKV